MKTYAKQSGKLSDTLQPKASKQASAHEILQAYKDKVAQKQDVEEEELLQGKFDTVQCEEIDEEELLQGKFDVFPTARKEVKQLQTGNDTGLPGDLKNGMEALSGYSMDDVRVHYNSPKPAQLQALAYAQGADIHIAPGQEKHLPHEAWHVVQQKQGRVRPTTQLQGVNVNDDEGLEKEADVMGGRSVQRTYMQVGSLYSHMKSSVIQCRSENPYNPNQGSTQDIISHHIIPYSLLQDSIKKFDKKTGIGIKKNFIPDLGNLTMQELNKQGQILTTKMTSSEISEKDKGVPIAGLDYKSDLQFKIEGGIYSYEALNDLLVRLKSAEINENYPIWFEDLADSFFDWQGGNLFYGPARIEPGKSSEFDSDASYIPGMKEGSNKLQKIYIGLKDAKDNGEVEKKLLELAEITRDKRPMQYDPNLWLKLNDEKATLLKEILKRDVNDNRGKMYVMKSVAYSAYKELPYIKDLAITMVHNSKLPMKDRKPKMGIFNMQPINAEDNCLFATKHHLLIRVNGVCVSKESYNCQKYQEAQEMIRSLWIKYLDS